MRQNGSFWNGRALLSDRRTRDKAPMYISQKDFVRAEAGSETVRGTSSNGRRLCLEKLLTRSTLTTVCFESISVRQLWTFRGEANMHKTPGWQIAARLSRITFGLLHKTICKNEAVSSVRRHEIGEGPVIIPKCWVFRTPRALLRRIYEPPCGWHLKLIFAPLAAPR